MIQSSSSLKISSRLSSIKPSITLAITQKAQELRAAGVDVISFSAGEPDFDTPTHIIDAAKRAMDGGKTRYTPVAGIAQLRSEVAKQSQKVRGVACDAKKVMISVGAKHVLFNFFQATLNAGDEVIIPSPYWVSYPDQVRLAGGKPVFAQTYAETGFILAPEDLEKVVTPKTKAIILNTPSNPTGAVYSKEAIKLITKKAIELNLWIVADEIYRDLIYDGYTHTSPLSVVKEGLDNVFIVDGVSKTYAMTGWRIGWGIGKPEVIAAMSKIQGQGTSSPASMCQEAALTAITSPMSFLDDWKAQYKARRDTIVNQLKKLNGVKCLKPFGAFYVLPDVSEITKRMGENKTDVDLATYLLDNANVATVPGSAFGAPGYLRLSYATSMDAIEEGIKRISKAFNNL